MSAAPSRGKRFLFWTIGLFGAQLFLFRIGLMIYFLFFVDDFSRDGTYGVVGVGAQAVLIAVACALSAAVSYGIVFRRPTADPRRPPR